MTYEREPVGQIEFLCHGEISCFAALTWPHQSMRTEYLHGSLMVLLTQDEAYNGGAGIRGFLFLTCTSEQHVVKL